MLRLTLLLIATFVAFTSTARAGEGMGLISSDQDGALPKSLWRNQPRSEINYLLKNLPPDSTLKSVQEIKRNMLLSYYDATSIKNDIEIKPGEDLLTLRLKKLIEMGLWEDAFKLYTKSTEDPGENDALAQIGVLLILTQKGLPTACLEQKVLAPRFPDTTFWKQIEAACAIELGAEISPEENFANSSILKAIFTDKDFTVSANSTEALNKLSMLELALLSNKGRINYTDMSNSDKISPHLLKTFLNDPKLPKSNKESLEKIARQKALLPESLEETPINNDENAKKAISQKQLTSQVAHKLKAGQTIADEEVKKLADLSPTNPENIFYIQILNETSPRQDYSEITEDVQGSEAAVLPLFENDPSGQKQEKVNFLKSLLDKSSEFSNNPANVYEKQISLTPDGGYVMPTGSPTNWLRITKQHQLVGLSLLIVLSNIDNNAYAKNSGDNPENDTVNVLKSLSTVGLIDQAHLIAKEELANLMELNT